MGETIIVELGFNPNTPSPPPFVIFQNLTVSQPGPLNTTLVSPVINNDGTRVAATAIDYGGAPDYYACTWDVTGNLTVLPDLNPGSKLSHVVGLSGDGTIVYGISDDLTNPGHYRPVKWTNGVVASYGFDPALYSFTTANSFASTGSDEYFCTVNVLVGGASECGQLSLTNPFTFFPVPGSDISPSFGSACNRIGALVPGSSFSSDRAIQRALVWENGTPNILSTSGFPGATISTANAVSANGAGIIGTIGSKTVRWGGLSGPPILMNQLSDSFAIGVIYIGRDGNFCVGQATDDSFVNWPVLWDSTGNLTTLPLISEINQSGVATDISFDNNVICGWGQDDNGNSEGCVWHRSGGPAIPLPRPPNADSLQCYTYGFSYNGLAIVGTGTNSDGYQVICVWRN